jgi:hypothetical protein
MANLSDHGYYIKSNGQSRHTGKNGHKEQNEDKQNKNIPAYNTNKKQHVHGTSSKLYGSDGYDVMLGPQMKSFKPDVCPDLDGKPKIFLFQSCTIENDGKSNENSTKEKTVEFLVICL